ncbi:unnamed protein product [Heterobilharzia americana]|nr:unnamed protein product [Heterobilharzia americana]
MSVCSLLEILSVTSQLSDPYNSTDSTDSVLKIRMLFTLYAEWSGVDFHTDFGLVKACVAVFPILASTSSSVLVPPVVESMLPMSVCLSVCLYVCMYVCM